MRGTFEDWALVDDKQGKHTDDDSSSANAADEPTAVWDSEALRQAGLDDLGPLPEPNVTPPATPALTATAPSIMVDPRATGSHHAAHQGAAKRKELSWGATVGLAVGLGGV